MFVLFYNYLTSHVCDPKQCSYVGQIPENNKGVLVGVTIILQCSLEIFILFISENVDVKATSRI